MESTGFDRSRVGGTPIPPHPPTGEGQGPGGGGPALSAGAHPDRHLPVGRRWLGPGLPRGSGHPRQVHLQVPLRLHPRLRPQHPIRFSARNDRSLLPYVDDTVVFINGEPKDSMKLVAKILISVAVLSLIIVVFF